MRVAIKKVRSKYIIQNIFGYTSFKRTIKIIQYNKNLINKLEYSVDDIKNFLFFNKIIKPISNCEDYLPIIKRILSSKNFTFKQILNVFCNYLNKNNDKFTPQISQIEENEYLLDKLDTFKLGFNKQILDYFSNFYLIEDKSLYIKKLSEFCKKYGKKIKEITFMDKEIEKVLNEDINYYTIIYIIKNCNIEKIEDCYNDNKLNSIFMGIIEDEKIFEKDYNNINSFDEEKKEKDLICSIKKLKSYSLYFDKISDFTNYDLINYVCDYILTDGNNIEELEITKITKSNQSDEIDDIPIEPFKTNCEYCGKKVTTCVKKEFNLTVFPYAVIIFYIFGFYFGSIILGLTFILFQNITHICPECFCEITYKSFYPIKQKGGYYSLTFGKCTIILKKILIIHIICYYVTISIIIL